MQYMQVRVFSGTPAQHESIARVCRTCLAADRELYSLQKTPDLVTICTGVALSESSMICFECRARIRGFVRFRSRALQAAYVLSRGVPKGKAGNFKTLSTLTQTASSPDNTICVNSDSVEEKLEDIDELQFMEEDQPLPATVEPLSEPVFARLADDDWMTDAKSEPGDNDDLNLSDKSDADSEEGDVGQI